MNHADFCVTPIARASSHELMPFLALVMLQTATNHFCSGRGLSSKIVPTFTENCFRHPLALHWNMRRLFISPIADPPHCGQEICPSGHLMDFMYSWQRPGSAKYTTASMSVWGNRS